MPTDRISRLLDDLRLHDQTRFELRVKRSHERSVHADWRFNPHPPLLAVETERKHLLPPGRGCFNPHPPLLAVETPVRRLPPQPRMVSIHTRHYWRVKPAGMSWSRWPIGVSIHTRHYWRVKQPGHSAVQRRVIGSFNPHPPLLAGETPAVYDQWPDIAFQSTPAITGG